MRLGKDAMKEGRYVKIIGIAGCYKRDGITKQMLDQVLANVGPENEVEQIFYWIMRSILEVLS